MPPIIPESQSRALRGLRALLIVLVLPWLIVCVSASRDGPALYAGCLVLFGGLAWALARRGAQEGWLEIGAWNVVLFFVLLEVVAQLYLGLGHPPNWLIAGPDQFAYRLDPAREYLGQAPNSAGFYDEEFTSERRPGLTRVVALGDSFAVGTVPLAENYLTRADADLGDDVQLYNLGVVHMAPRQYLEILQSDGLALDPDVVLVGIYLGNDIRPDPPRGLLSGWGSAAVVGLRRSWTLLSKGQLGVASGTQQMFRTDEDGTRVELPLVSVDDYLTTERKHLDRLMGPPEQPREIEAWRDTERALEDLVGLCRERGIPVLFTIAPAELQVSPTLVARVAERFALDPSDYDLEYPTRRVQTKLAELGVPVLDLGDVLRAAEAEAPTYHLRGVHWNRFGNEVVAQALAPWLREQLSTLPPRSRDGLH